ncbi:hypothetical protein LRB67_04790 [Borreliella bissettiae]|uniref:hypothetical protein n=1 Tax=Borrelia bissettiae TaxID=64897 RepID=UPI001E2B80D9|nr:hypothetical protein [Borreliella bissettiae]MCD2401577.1 hypothetical protein [Borreliella bissettiae]
MHIFILFSACNPNFNTEKKDIKYPPTEKSRPKIEDSNTKTENLKQEEEAGLKKTKKYTT